MICIEIPAKAACDEPGCTASKPISLALNCNGTLGFGFDKDPTSNAWQIYSENGYGPIQSRCSEHHLKVQTVSRQIGPAGPRLIVDAH